MPQPAIPGHRWPWIRLFGRSPGADGSPADDAQRGYAEVALELLARCDELHRGWLEQLDEQRRHERLANAAAIYHWYLSALRERLGTVEAPPSLRAWHEALAAALDSAGRATQLMSHGYRFYNVRRICDGGVLLEEALGQAAAVRDGLARLRDVDALSAPRPAERSAGS